MQRKQIFIHLAICLGFLLVPVIFFTGELINEKGRLHSMPYDTFNLITYILLLVFFYLNYYIFIPKYFLTKKYSIYIWIILSFFIFLIPGYYMLKASSRHHHAENHLVHIDNHVLHHKPNHPNSHNKHHQKLRKSQRPIFQTTQLILLSFIGLLIGLYLRMNKNLETIRNEKNKAEISYLKSQINPHFLFNTLNSLYSLAIKEKADKTANGMLELSSMMRYVITESDTDFVTLDKELNYIHDYIELQKLRIDESVKLDYSIVGSNNDYKIAPLILIPFIENCFKYGVNPDEKSEIIIRIDINQGNLHLYAENKKVQINNFMNEKIGLGIQNTENRLRMIYPDCHELKVQDGINTFTIDLKLNLVT